MSCRLFFRWCGFWIGFRVDYGVCRAFSDLVVLCGNSPFYGTLEFLRFICIRGPCLALKAELVSAKYQPTFFGTPEFLNFFVILRP